LNFFADQKDNFEILHNKIPVDQYRAIQERARMNVDNVFADLQAPKVEKRYKGDVKGAILQQHAITLAQEGMTALQCIDQGVATKNVGMFDIAGTCAKDIITMASVIVKFGVKSHNLKKT
jgi:hypothetical protein